MNHCCFIGRIGRDAVVRFTQGGKPVASFSVAVDVGFGDKKSTIWLDCAVWGERAQKLSPLLLKGDRVGVVGAIGLREHEGKTYITLDVQDATLLGEKRPAAQPAPAGDAPLRAVG